MMPDKMEETSITFSFAYINETYDITGLSKCSNLMLPFSERALLNSKFLSHITYSEGDCHYNQMIFHQT